MVFCYIAVFPGIEVLQVETESFNFQSQNLEAYTLFTSIFVKHGTLYPLTLF